MKSIKNTIPLFIFCILLMSCKGNKKSEPGSTQMKKVMAIHDEVMPEMSTLGNLVGELSSKEDSTEIGLKYTATKKELQAAHKSMMDWMKGFGDRFDSDEILNGKELSEQKQKWLDEEEEKVKALRNQINESIEKAKILLGTDK